MRFGFEHARDGKIPELRRRVFNAFDFEPDKGEFRRDLIERSVGLQVIFQPGEREFHGQLLLHSTL